MKQITSITELLKKLKRQNLLSNGIIFYLTDFHRTKVLKSIVDKLIRNRMLESTSGYKEWFESEWKLRKPTGNHLGVDIYQDQLKNQFFFTVKKVVYDFDSYEECIIKIEFLSQPIKKVKP